MMVFIVRLQIVLYMLQRQLLVVQLVIPAMVYQLWYSLDMLQVGVHRYILCCCWLLIDTLLGEENEMTLNEGEVIVQIDQVDEGWWYGVSEDGKRQGLFPGKKGLHMY